MTWWRDWKRNGEMRFGMGNLISGLHLFFRSWSEIEKEFGFDSEQLDCVLEQLWAIREGLSD